MITQNNQCLKVVDLRAVNLYDIKHKHFLVIAEELL